MAAQKESLALRVGSSHMHFLVLFWCVDVIISVSILHLQDGRNALHIAAFNGHLEVVKYLIPKFGQRKFDKDNAGKTCLDRAFEKQKHNVVNFLSQEGGFSGQR